jgi:hypothetical protein
VVGDGCPATGELGPLVEREEGLPAAGARVVAPGAGSGGDWPIADPVGWAADVTGAVVVAAGAVVPDVLGAGVGDTTGAEPSQDTFDVAAWQGSGWAALVRTDSAGLLQLARDGDGTVPGILATCANPACTRFFGSGE